MLNFFYKHRGSVTILLLVIMFPMLVFSFTIVDIAKIYMARDITADATQLAMNAGMTSYDKVLKDMYGILATSTTEEELSKKLSAYYAATLAASGLSGGEEDASQIITNLIGQIDNYRPNDFKDDDYLRVVPELVEGATYVKAHTLPASSASNPAVLKRQIVEYMKYRGPMNMATGILEKLNFLKDLPNQAKVTNDRIEFEKTLSNINNDAIDAYTLIQIFFYNNRRAENTSETFDIVFPNEKTDTINQYKYDNNSGGIKAADMLAAYESGKTNDMAKVEQELKKASLAMILIAPYSNADISDSMSTNSLTGSTTVTDHYSDGKTLDYATALEDQHTVMKNAEYYSLDYEGFINCLKDKDEANKKAEAFYTDFSNGDIETSLKLKHSLVVAAYFYRKTHTDGSWGNALAKSISEFIKMYDYVQAQYDTLKKGSDDEETAETSETEEEDSESEMKQKQLKDMSDILEKYNDEYNSLRKAVANTPKVVNKIYTDARSYLSSAATKADNVYSFAYKQLTILNTLTDPNGALYSLLDLFASAQTQAVAYQGDIKEVEINNQQNSAQQTFDYEAKHIYDFKQQDVEDLVTALNSYKNYYQLVIDAVKDLRVLYECDSGSLTGTRFMRKKGGDESNYAGCTDIKQLFNDAGNVSEIINNITTTYALDNRYTFYNYQNRGSALKSGEVEITAWSDLYKEEVYQNKAYIELETMSVPAKDIPTNPDTKDALQKNAGDLTNTDNGGSSDSDSQGMPKAVSDEQKENDKNEEPTEEEKEAFKNMANAKGFYDYIDEHPEVGEKMERTDEIKLKGVGGSVDMKDNDSATTGATGLLDSVSQLMNNLGELLGSLAENGRDAFLVTEYFTSNFSCFTTSMDGTGKRKNDEKMLSGTLFCEEDLKNVGYGCELEYILYGQDTMLANQACAGGTIFAIRFVLNLIYSFTDPEIRSFTMSVALAATGAFPFLTPIVQTVLHIGLALAESGIDLYYLMNGAAVPLYKSPATWVCKGSNIIRKAAGELITKVSEEVIDTVSNNLCDKITELGDNITDKMIEETQELKDYVDQESKAIQAQIQAAVMAPVQEVVQYCMLNITRIQINEKNLEASAKEQITTLLSDALSNAITSLEAEGNDMVSKNAVKALKLIQEKQDSIAGKILENIDKLIDTAVGDTFEDVTEELKDEIHSTYTQLDKFIEDNLTEVTEAITGTINGAIGEIESTLTQAVKSAVSELNDAVNKTSESIKEKINSKVTEAVTGHKDVTITSGGKATSADHALDMTYKDYLYIFTLLGSFDNKNTAMFERAAKLMQANCERRKAPTNYTDANLGKDIYSLNAAYTLIQATSGASTSTVFYGSVFKDGELDVSGRKDYEFTYMSYMGY